MAALLDVRDLVVSARQEDGSLSPVVKGVSFDVQPGEVVALIGESGSGKTTIALSALAYSKPGLEFAGGEVRLKDRNLFSLPPREIRRLRMRQVAYLAQSAAAAFNPALTIGEQVTECAMLSGVLTREAAAERAKELYRALELPEPETLGRRYPHQVSGGQLQRLMAAMALCGGPDLLVLDEPTTALDVTTQIEVLKAFKKVIREAGSAAVYVSHDLAVVAQIADRIVVLYDGRVQEQGTAEDIVLRPNHAYTRRLMAAVSKAPDASAVAEPAKPAPAEGPPALQVKGVSAGYGPKVGEREAVRILHDIDVTLVPGGVVGVIGESGCGKSTLARVVAGLLPASEGEILLEGRPLAPALKQRPRDHLRRIQIVFQMADTALNPRQRVGEILGRPCHFYLGLKGAARRHRVAELLEMVELSPRLAHRYPWELSGGQKQRVNLARALAAEPQILLCDEVTSALDSIVGANVLALLKRLRRDLGVSFAFISHDLSTVASFADHVVVLYAGRVVEQGPTAKVLAPPYHPYTRLLIASVPELRVGWLEETMRSRAALAGIARSVELLASGCPYHKRCPLAIEGLCEREMPPPRAVASGHLIACHALEQEQFQSGPARAAQGHTHPPEADDPKRAPSRR